MLFYYNEPDGIGHAHGPDSAQLLSKLRELNECLGMMLAVLESEHRIHDSSEHWSVNILLVSDHGMVAFTRNATVPVRPDLYVIHSHDYVEVMLQPLPGKLNESLQLLRAIDGVDVFTKEHIPDSWHYSHTQRVDKVRARLNF